MLENAISDTRLQKMTKDFIATQREWRTALKGLYLCGSQIVRQTGSAPAVFVMANNKVADFFGIAECHSAWACPRCTAKVMSKKGRRIASAIDALSTLHHQSAIMVTFTLPHTKFMSCEDTFTILRDTWRKFTKDLRATRQKQYVLKTDKQGNKGETRTYTIDLKTNGYARFREECEIKHFVKVYEFTWGTDNSWHPHMHVLFWIPNKNWNKILSHEDSLLDSWWICARREALKYWNKKRPDRKEENKKFVEELYADWRKICGTNRGEEHKSVYISKDKHGSPIKQKSSLYLQGWGADNETTGLAYKKAQEGHVSIHQIYELAFNSHGEEREKWLKLYIEYALATRSHRRVEFSKKSGINQIIDAWEKTHDYIEIYKKKATAKAQENIHLVCWFNEQQWYQICLLERSETISIKHRILELARAPDGKQLITKFLLEYNVDISKNGIHHREDDINKLFVA